VKLRGERLLARLVAKRLAPGIGARRAADEREHEQGALRDAPAPVLGPLLVDPEGRESREVNGDERRRQIGGRQQGQ